MKTFSHLRLWLHSNPLTAVGFTFLFTLLAACMGFMEEWFEGCLIVFVVLLTVFALVLWKQGRRLMIIALLAVALVTPTRIGSAQPAPQQDGSGGGCLVAVGVVIVVVGVVIVVKLIKFCQRHFPGDSGGTNSPPASLVFDGSGGAPDTYSASLNFGSLGSCWPGDACAEPEEASPQTTEISVSIGDEGALSASLSGHSGKTATFQELQRQSARLGLVVSEHAGNFSYARNGESIPESASPIRWDYSRGVARVLGASAPYYTVTVERSHDLQGWTRLASVEAEVGRIIRFQDTSAVGQCFYRFNSRLSD